MAENPLNSMTWEQRFYAAFGALLAMEMKYGDAVASATEIHEEMKEKIAAVRLEARPSNYPSLLSKISGLRQRNTRLQRRVKRLEEARG